VTYWVYVLARPLEGAVHRRHEQSRGGSSSIAAGLCPASRRSTDCIASFYFEDSKDVLAAIAREKQIKAWTLAALIESMNPTWQDLAADWFEAPPFVIPSPRAISPV